MRVLGIETSCDETAAAVVTDEGEVLSDVVRSQIASHAPFGGVVPEIAARDHQKALPLVIAEALSQASMSLGEIDGIAVTRRPGLTGALLVGLQGAKGLAWATDKPFVGVDHLVGHLLAAFLRRDTVAGPRPRFPFVGLLASGGHTAIYLVEGPTLNDIRELGATRDDAAGEAFDKVGKLLGLGYPGGPVVDKLAATGEARRASSFLPTPMANKDSLEFSFSGLKSAVARHVEHHGVPLGQDLTDLCAAFQERVVGALVDKTVRAALREKKSQIVIGGGVAANRGLRTRMTEVCARHAIEVVIPPLASCTDNAAMIAYVGALRLVAGERDALDLGPETRTALLRVTRKGGGKRSTEPRPRPPR